MLADADGCCGFWRALPLFTFIRSGVDETNDVAKVSPQIYNWQCKTTIPTMFVSSLLLGLSAIAKAIDARMWDNINLLRLQVYSSITTAIAMQENPTSTFIASSFPLWHFAP